MLLFKKEISIQMAVFTVTHNTDFQTNLESFHRAQLSNLGSFCSQAPLTDEEETAAPRWERQNGGIKGYGWYIHKNWQDCPLAFVFSLTQFGLGAQLHPVSLLFCSFFFILLRNMKFLFFCD